MKKRVVITFLIILFFCISLVFGKPFIKLFSNDEIYKRKLNAEKLTSLVNKWRVESGFQPYKISEALCEIAEKRLPELLENFNHDKFEDDYATYSSVLQENANKGYFEESHTLNGWLNSPPHRRTLEKNYEYSCIATKDDYSVQIFSNCENGCP